MRCLPMCLETNGEYTASNRRFRHIVTRILGQEETPYFKEISTIECESQR